MKVQLPIYLKGPRYPEFDFLSLAKATQYTLAIAFCTQRNSSTKSPQRSNQPAKNLNTPCFRYALSMVHLERARTARLSVVRNDLLLICTQRLRSRTSGSRYARRQKKKVSSA